MQYIYFPHYETSVQGGVTTATRSYFFGGVRIAQKVGSGALTYLHADHLGSTVLTTGVSGSKKYHAYGSARSGSVPTDIQFTGQMTSTTGLVYMHARYYDPVTGIFISPDTIIPDPSSVFDYNRYMYARGNPLKYSDPSGHCVFGLDTIVCVIAAAAAAGAGAGFVGNLGGQAWEQWDEGETWQEYKQSLDLSFTEAGIAAGAGAIGGGSAPLVGPVAYVAINATAGAGQKVVTDMLIEDKTFGEAAWDIDTAIAATLSGGLSAIGPKVPKQLVYTASNGEQIIMETGEYAAAVGGSQFASQNEAALTAEQLSAVTSQRGFTAGLLAQLPWLPDWFTEWLPMSPESD